MFASTFLAMFALVMMIAALASAKYIVIVQFQDMYNPSRVFRPGDDLPQDFRGQRLEDLKRNGYVLWVDCGMGSSAPLADAGST